MAATKSIRGVELAINELNRRTKLQAQEAVPLNPNGTNQYSERGVDNSKLHKVKGGNNPEYLTARIARDHPAILERMKAGEFKSVRQAAIEVGIVVPIRKITITLEDPVKAAETIVRAIKSGRISKEFLDQVYKAAKFLTP